MKTDLANASTQRAGLSKFNLLFVDDEPDIVDSLKRGFRKAHTVLTATSGNEALELLKNNNVDLIISDQRMPGMTGDELLAKAKVMQPDSIRILLTGYSDLESMIKCVNEANIYKYLTKPWEPEVLKLTVDRALEHLDVSRKLKMAAEQLKDAYHDAVTMLSFACEGKDEETSLHVHRVQLYTEVLAREIGLADDDVIHLGIMSILHDIGKLNVSDVILKKPGKLDGDEWQVMKEHTENGVRILGNNQYYSVAREIAGNHHENWDGTGYPKGLKGEEIPLSARIVKIADVFDALTSRRPYKEPWHAERAIEYLKLQANYQFDPNVVEAFLRLQEMGTIEEIMQLAFNVKQLHGDHDSKLQEWC